MPLAHCAACGHMTSFEALPVYTFTMFHMQLPLELLLPLIDASVQVMTCLTPWQNRLL